MAPATRDRPRALAALDGWRGICALLVALLHLDVASHVHALALLQNAHLFVDFFFVLSGFIISHAYLARLGSAAEAGVMIWRRLARLWPLHVAMLAAFVALELGASALATLTGLARRQALFDPASSALLEAVPTHLALLHSMGVHDRLTWNIPSWSISAEMWTYVVFALVIVLWRRWSAVLALGLAALGAGVVIACSSELMSVHHDLGFFRCLYGFFVGHLVYLARRSSRPSHMTCTALEAAAVVVVIVHVALFGRTVLAFAAPLVFAATVWIFAQEGGALSRLLTTRPLQLLGRWSYAIYMLHALIIAVGQRAATVLGARTAWIAEGGAWAMDLLVLAYLAALIPLAALAWRLIEMPAQRMINDALERRMAGSLLPQGAR